MRISRIYQVRGLGLTATIAILLQLGKRTGEGAKTMETITAIVDFIHETRNYYDQFNRQYYVDRVAQYNLKKLTVTAALDDGDFMQGIDNYL